LLPSRLWICLKPVSRPTSSDGIAVGPCRRCQDGLKDLQSSRDKARGVTDGGGKPARDQVWRYWEALERLHSRVDLSETNSKLQVAFTWTDAYFQDQWKPKKATQKNANFEKAALLFNIAALLSHEACAKDMKSDTGLKEAYNLFAEAVGIFDHLKSEVVPSLGQPLTPDLSEDALSFASALMTAQAQQCFYMKANLAGMKRAVLAKLAQGTADAYSLAAGMVDSPNMRTSQIYKPRLQCSTQWFMADAEYKIACHEQEQLSIGNEIARLRRAQSTMGEASKFAKHAPGEQQEELEQLRQQARENPLRAFL
jgi:programmed cell death 6-interacting protein